MTVFAILMTALAWCLGFRLYLFQRQLRDLTGQLKNFSPESNQRLTCFLRDRSVINLCREINRCIDEEQQAVLDASELQQKLQYTITCVSHDIRTPLTGASGYMQLLENTQDAGKRLRYCQVVRRKLSELEQLLDELFLYTRLTSGRLPLECQPVQLYLAVCEALAGWYETVCSTAETGAFATEKAEAAPSMEPLLCFSDESLSIQADPPQLGRVLRNLISNAFTHGYGTLSITQSGSSLIFSNQVAHPEQVHPEQMFERFYRDDASRRGSHAGLGLSIARELMERMGGSVSGELSGNVLSVTLTFAPAERRPSL